MLCIYLVFALINAVLATTKTTTQQQPTKALKSIQADLNKIIKCGDGRNNVRYSMPHPANISAVSALSHSCARNIVYHSQAGTEDMSYRWLTVYRATTMKPEVGAVSDIS